MAKGGKGGGGGDAGGNSKKAQGQARKAAAADAKKAAVDQQRAAVEDAEWSKGAKSNSKAEAAAAKKAEADRKRAEKAALEAEEAASMPKGPSKGKQAAKKGAAPSRGLDAALSSLDAPANKKAATLNASGIDNALDALSVSNTNPADKIDRHPERRFKAAYAAYEERRLDEMKDEKGLRRNQKIDQIRKEFEKHPDNPFNQVSASYNATREEVAEIKQQERAKVEKRLAGAD
ncbi:coiled-coil domain-containing protein [Phyllosticta citriasiana]|uniref:Coiled-coil domain-containing protein n=1 Tax=Phyllosticta citriasiana TaxID=595635 RepID=A0ABR1KXM4_9PEZI